MQDHLRITLPCQRKKTHRDVEIEPTEESHILRLFLRPLTENFIRFTRQALTLSHHLTMARNTA